MALDFLKPAPGETWTVRIIHGTSVGPKSVTVGEVLTLPVHEAAMLICCRKAERYTAPPPPVVLPVESAPVPEVDRPPATADAPTKRAKGK